MSTTTGSLRTPAAVAWSVPSDTHAFALNVLKTSLGWSKSQASPRTSVAKSCPPPSLGENTTGDGDDVDGIETVALNADFWPFCDV